MMVSVQTDFLRQIRYGEKVEVSTHIESIGMKSVTLQQQILLGAIAEKEGITLSDDEFQDILQGYADQYGMTVEEMLGYWNEDSVRESELENKVMEYLESVTTVKETDETEADTEPVFEATGEGDTGADDAQTES